MAKRVITSSENLARLLSRSGCALDMRCGGSGKCGRCRVKLVSGEWESAGTAVTPPCEVLACRTHLTGRAGVVEIPEAPEADPAVEMALSDRVVLKPTADTVAALDVGTTTLAAVTIRDGKVTASAGCFNAQSRYGDNVISRIAHTAASHGMDELRAALAESLAKLAVKLDISRVSRVAVAGNTVMLSLLFGIDPSPIGAYPFTPKTLTFPEHNDLFGELPVAAVPCISGFLGGDITAGLLVAELSPGDMLVDLGTNCEIVFNTGNGWFGTTAAAGPAFEGAGLRCGCRAVAGAVDHYRCPGDFSVIGGGAPRGGLCGSAYIDYLAVEHRAGRIDGFGRFRNPAEHCREIAPGLSIGEDDLEQLLKAKAAIGSGIASLEKYCGKSADRIFLAGGFASVLDLGNAAAIGMLPAGREYVVIGNSSLAGAAALAADPELMPELLRLSKKPEELPLAGLPGFERTFADALLLN